jgi:hypothetical protein
VTGPLQTAQALLIASEHCVVATQGAAGLTCGTMFYGIASRWRLVLISHSDSRQVANIRETGECLVVVARVPTRFGDPALQIRAQCRALVADQSSLESDITRALYDRFPPAARIFAELAEHGRPSIGIAADVISIDLLDERTYGVGNGVRLQIVPPMIGSHT